MLDTSTLLAKGKEYYLPIYRPRETILVRGQGARVWDKEEKEYIDFSAGIAVNSLGHQHPALMQALIDQAHKIWHTSNVFYSEPPILLAEALIQSSGFAEKVYLCNSGTEANEAAIKLIRKYAAQQGKPEHKRVIITFKGSFHGRTLAAVTATAQPKYQEGYEPLPAGFAYCDFNDFDAITAMMGDHVAGILVEPVQGEGGVMPAKEGFLAHLRQLCDQHGALLALDEIQCGMGRTGKLYAHEWDLIKPDLVTIAKALGCGIPIAALLVGEKAAQTMQFGAHGTTFGGNPLAAAVAYAALNILKSEQLLEHVTQQSEKLKAGLISINDKLHVFKEIRGRGLMLGAVLADQYESRAGEILPIGQQFGLLLLQAGTQVLRFVPPLNITDEELAEGLQRLDVALTAFVAQANASKRKRMRLAL